MGLGALKAFPGPSPHPDSSRSQLGSTCCVAPGKLQALRPKYLIKGLCPATLPSGLSAERGFRQSHRDRAPPLLSDHPLDSESHGHAVGPPTQQGLSASSTASLTKGSSQAHKLPAADPKHHDWTWDLRSLHNQLK